MDDSHEQLQEDVVAYALGALDVSDRARIEEHLASCPECTELFNEYLVVNGMLPFTLPVEAPPLRVREAILAQARASKAQPQTVMVSAPRSIAPESVAPPGPRSVALREVSKNQLTRFMRPLRWAAVAAIIIGLLGWNISLQLAQGELRDQIAQITNQANKRTSILVSTPAAQGANGQLVLRSDNSRGTLVVTGLPQLPPGQVYQFWFARPDKSRDSAGIFRVGASGEALLAVTVPGAIEQYNQIWITKEPGPNPSPKPTAPHYLEGPL